MKGAVTVHYLGTFNHTLDAKGRLFIPARFRESLGEEFVLFKSPDRCLSIYDSECFNELITKVHENALTVEDRVKARRFLSGAVNVSMDKQGRITLPQDYIEFASLGTDVVILGEANRLEIWRKDAPEITELFSGEFSADLYPSIVY